MAKESNKKPLTISICNQKGGVGKTTTCNNLGKYLSSLGFKVLLIDNDPQGNLSMSFTGKVIADEALVLDVYDGKFPEPLKINDNLFIYCANEHLTTVESRGIDSYFQLKEGLVGLLDSFDIILIDCPPSLGCQLISAITASDYCLVIANTTDFSSQGLNSLVNNMLTLKKRTNPKVSLFGILFAAVDLRTKEAKEVELKVRDAYKKHVFSSKTRKAAVMSKTTKSVNSSRSIVDISPSSPVAKDFGQFVSEFLKRLNLSKKKRTVISKKKSTKKSKRVA